MIKKAFITLFCLILLLGVCLTAYAEKTTLYALDGRTLLVDESQIQIYTAEGMGWFLEKPVTMYSADGRTIVVTADRVEAQKAVGWFVKEEQPATSTPEVAPETPENNTPTNSDEAIVKYTDGTLVKVPEAYVSMYATLGWERVYPQFNGYGNVIVYNVAGDSREIIYDDVEKFIKEGWLLYAPGTAPEQPSTPEVSDTEKIMIYDAFGASKEIFRSEADSYKAKGWGLTYDEAVYLYATSGNGEEQGSVALLNNKKYELAFRKIDEALSKIGSGNSQYVTMLYALRSEITKTWNTAAISPLGFINYWFDTKDGKRTIVFEYRNVGDKMITSFRLNFDTCDAEGKVIETNAGSYYINNLQLSPCDKTRVRWVVKSGDSAVSAKNIKVKEVTFSDGTVWKTAE